MKYFLVCETYTEVQLHKGKGRSKKAGIVSDNVSQEYLVAVIIAGHCVNVHPLTG